MFIASRARFRRSSPQLLLGSNNYIANQVFLEIGGTLGGPVSLEKSLKVANAMLAANGLADAIHLEEGSGISRDNHFTARGLAKVLHLFEPHATLLRSGARRPLQDRHLFRRPHLGGLRRHLQARAGALRDRAQEQRQRDALPAAQGHPVRAVAGVSLAGLTPRVQKNPMPQFLPHHLTGQRPFSCAGAPHIRRMSARVALRADEIS